MHKSEIQNFLPHRNSKNKWPWKKGNNFFKKERWKKKGKVDRKEGWNEGRIGREREGGREGRREKEKKRRKEAGPLDPSHSSHPSQRRSHLPLALVLCKLQLRNAVHMLFLLARSFLIIHYPYSLNHSLPYQYWVFRRDKENRISRKLQLCLSPLLLMKGREHSNQGRANLCKENMIEKSSPTVYVKWSFLCFLHISSLLEL